MDESKQTAFDVNTSPENRKRLRNQSETSPFFAPSGTAVAAAIERSEGYPSGEQGEKTESKPKQRQARLVFNGDQLIAQRPLTNPDRNEERRERLSKVAKETQSLLPGLLHTRPDAPPKGYLCEGKQLDTDQRYCPRLPATKIRVINADSIDAALDLDDRKSGKPPLVLNMANAFHAGGGWLTGSLAQEECLCYRTSLYFTLKHRFYPIPDRAAIYSPTVLVIRESMSDGNNLLDCRDPRTLRVVSVVSVAAVCRPPLTSSSSKLSTYVNIQDVALMKDKIRAILRTAMRNNHRQIVLGALGCGAFGNPKEEVADMFASILQETEFAGGWWEDVVFAVLDDGRGNFQTFRRTLHGLRV